jgi:ankyrin repeat protein
MWCGRASREYKHKHVRWLSPAAAAVQAGQTPLSLAAARGHHALLLLLLARNAEPGVVSTARSRRM